MRAEYWLKKTFRLTSDCDSALELHAMRMGPGKHLKGRTLMGGIVTPEEVRSIAPNAALD